MNPNQSIKSKKILDGTCQPLKHRCDLKADCKDRSDEENCKKVIFPLDYEKALAPKHTINGERVDDPLPVYLSLDILSFDKIDTVNMEIGWVQCCVSISMVVTKVPFKVPT